MIVELLEGVNAKVCKECGELKLFNDFSKHKTCKYGLESKCKVCRNKNNKTYRENNVEKERKRSKTYYTNNRDIIKERHKQYTKTHKVEKREYDKQYTKTHKVEKREYDKNHFINNRDYHREKNRKQRAIKRSAIGNFTEKEFKQISLEFFDWKCAYTGELILEDLSNCHREHIVPLSKGGDNGIWNIVPSLDWVNLSKNNSDMEDWYRQQSYFSEERLERIYEYMRIMEEKYLLEGCI